MKKLFLILSIFSISFNVCHAQKVGIKAGINFANAQWESVGTAISNQSLTGFQIGLILDFAISDPVYINTGAFYSLKGSKTDILGVEVELPISYLEIPINLAYKIDASALKVYLQAGPYFGIGLSAKAQSGGTSVDIDFGSDDDELKALDVGLNLGAGIEVSSIQLGLNYGLGLTNLENADDNLWKNQVFSVTIAYFLKK